MKQIVCVGINSIKRFASIRVISGQTPILSCACEPLCFPAALTEVVSLSNTIDVPRDLTQPT